VIHRDGNRRNFTEGLGLPGAAEILLLRIPNKFRDAARNDRPLALECFTQ
jgi:hypothetical protein